MVGFFTVCPGSESNRLLVVALGRPTDSVGLNGCCDTMTDNSRYPTRLETVPPAATVTDAVSVAETYLDECADEGAFVDIAKTALIRGRQVEAADLPSPILDRLERRASATWHTVQTAKRREKNDGTAAG